MLCLYLSVLTGEKESHSKDAATDQTIGVFDVAPWEKVLLDLLSDL
jgi:hypothetical protein